LAKTGSRDLISEFPIT